MYMLKKNKEFKKVYSTGESWVTANLVLYTKPNNLAENRCGFSISKKIGKAVIRNKLRRRLKEILRLNDHKMKKGYDLIFIARKAVVELDYKKLERNVYKLLQKAGIWG